MILMFLTKCGNAWKTFSVTRRGTPPLLPQQGSLAKRANRFAGTAPDASDGIADRRIALFVPPAYQAMWEAGFGRVSEEGGLHSSPEVNVAGPDGTDDDVKEEEKSPFSLRPISASLLQGAWQGCAVRCVSCSTNAWRRKGWRRHRRRVCWCRCRHNHPC